MMKKRLDENPIFTHLTRRARWPSLRLAFWLAVALAVVYLVLCAVELRRTLTTDHAPFVLSFLLSIPVWMLLIGVSPAVGIVGVVITQRFVRDEAFDTIRVTPVSPRQLVEGCIGGALYRLRLLLALVLGLSPLAVCGFTNLIVYLLDEGYFYYHSGPYHVTAFDVIAPLVEIAVTVTGLLLLSLLGAVAGVALALRFPRSGVLGTILPVVLLVMALFEVIVILATLGPATSGQAYTAGGLLFEGAILVGFCFLPPVLLTVAARRLALKAAVRIYGSA